MLNDIKDLSVVYDSWNSFFSSHPDYIVDKTSTSKDIVNTAADGGSTTYTVTSAIGGATSSERSTNIVSNVNVKAAAMDIHFEATGLSPLTRMYVYVNNRFMNGYVTPDNNPIGIITGISIDDVGSGYASNSTISLSDNSTITATFDLSVRSEEHTSELQSH